MEGSRSVERIINQFRVHEVTLKIMKMMEEEKLNIAEAKILPEYLSKTLSDNDKRIKEMQPFVVAQTEAID